MKITTIKIGDPAREVPIRKLLNKHIREHGERIKALKPTDSAEMVYVEQWRMVCLAAELAGHVLTPEDRDNLDHEDVVLAYADVLEWSKLVKRGEAVSP